MSLRRENDFPATSISRTSGARLQQTVAHEAHPLLSPGPASPTPSEHGSLTGQSTGGATLSVNGSTRYVPYTPRQRVTPTAATTGTTVHPPSPQQHAGDATSKLQLMHLKAAAQAIGLDSGTLGWSILERLVSDAESSEEWTEVWNAITSGKATLLLPLEAAFAHEKITADFVKDHIVLCDGSSRKNAPVITLSGLRGTLENETLAFRSTLNPTSKQFQDLLNPTTRTSSLALLPALPLPLSDIPKLGPTYPQFHVPSYSSSLHLPPRSHGLSKPPLPPRPGTRPVPPPASSTPRISNPFASLFGGSKSAPVAVPASPPSSLHSLDSAHDNIVPVEVSAFSIDRRIVRKDIAKEVNKALKAELKAALGHAPMPSWIVERVHEITAEWYPFVKALPAKKKVGQEKSPKEPNGHSQGFVVNTIKENPDDAADRLQDFFLSLEHDLRTVGTPKRKDKEAESETEDERGREKWELETETRVRSVLEAVERTITSLFYDRLFMQPTTDDASHDEALSNRIAALNMLDLGLGHLGIQVSEEVNEADMNAVVRACGDMLTQLDSCRGPGDKAAILVAAHKIVVDGLSRLPPIRLISEEESHTEDDPQTAKPPPDAGGGQSESKFLASTEPLEPNLESSALFTPPPPPAAPSEPATESASTSSIEQPSPAGDKPPSKVKPLPPPLPLDEPILKVSTPKEPTPVSGDVLLPIIIFSVVKANPPHLVSNLLYTQRFRNHSVGGEESYCLINLMAVAEFLENVDMAALGLGDSDNVLSTADLTPIPLARSPVTSETPLAPGGSAGLRGRVEQHVDAIADSANKVISGVVDSSFGILRSFMPNGNPIPLSLSGRTTPNTPGATNAQLPSKAGFGLLRRESGFSIAGLAASLPIAGRSRSGTATGEEAGQQLVSVSRPPSVRSRSRSSLKIRVGDGDESGEEESDDGDGTGTTDEDEDESEEDGAEAEDEAVEGEDGVRAGTNADTRSIRSFESMLSASKDRHKGTSARPRKTLSDRLASVSALAGFKGSSPPGSRRSSLLLPPAPKVTSSPTTSRPSSPVQQQQQQLRLAPPKQRFIECTPDDLRLSEVGELLRDYRRLVEGIRAAGGFDE